MSEEVNVKTPQEQDSDFVDKLVSQALGGTEVQGIKMRPPTLGTVAILTKLQNALVTGIDFTEDTIMMHCLQFMWVHSVDPEELHGAAMLTNDGRNLAIERKSLELGDKLPFSGGKQFEDLFTELNAWINKHVESRVEPIPDKDSKPDPDPNE